MIHPVILCGGSGIRLWPTSRASYPKQFGSLFGGESLFQKTLRRFDGAAFSPPMIITREEFRFIATEQARAAGIQNAQIIVEPSGHNTGPAALVAALHLDETPDALLLIAPSDHRIDDLQDFRNAIEAGTPAARDGAIVTFGITAETPETGYGYLEVDGSPDDAIPMPVKKFTEKPDKSTAHRMIETGNTLWNAGIFLCRVDTLVSEFKRQHPQLLELCRTAMKDGQTDLGFFRLAAAPYAKLPNSSLDYAIMENARSVVAIPLHAGWSDLGSWNALHSAEAKDDKGNSISGNATALDCTETYLRSDEPSMQLVGLGLEGVVAVATRDAVLVAAQDRVGDVGQAVDALRAKGAHQADHAPREHRPWGWFETLCLGGRFRVKQIMVNPGGVLSLQSHVHRSEHWVVVEGTAEVTIGDETRLVTENESVYVPLGKKHRLSNPGQMPMYLIEVQTGAYLGEDDVERHEDIYNRSSKGSD